MIQIQKVTDKAFQKYGKVVEGIDNSELLAILEKMPMPEGVDYFPGIPELEATEAAKLYSESFFGQMPIQVGCCNGHNSLLNAVEYHRNSEINIALYDMVLLLAAQQDIDENFHLDTKKVEAFLVPAGVAVELYATTLHYAPCNVEDRGFKGIVILPKGTNGELKGKVNCTPEDKLITAVNKWLIAHKDGGCGDAFVGLDGENISIR